MIPYLLCLLILLSPAAVAAATVHTLDAFYSYDPATKTFTGAGFVYSFDGPLPEPLTVALTAHVTPAGALLGGSASISGPVSGTLEGPLTDLLLWDPEPASSHWLRFVVDFPGEDAVWQAFFWTPRTEEEILKGDRGPLDAFSLAYSDGHAPLNSYLTPLEWAFLDTRWTPPQPVPTLPAVALVFIGGTVMFLRRWAPAFIIGGLAVWLSGCAPTWVQAGRQPTALEVDTYECKLEGERVYPLSSGPYGGLVYALATIGTVRKQADVTRQCMHLRGYEAAK